MNETPISSVRVHYNRLAAEYDERWSGYVEGATKETIRRLSLRPRDRLLDVGCGTGILLEQVHSQWPSVRTVGIDLSEEMLLVARRRLRGRVPLVQGDVAQLPFAGNFFDVVVSNSSLHYWPHPRRVLAEIARVLRRGGRLVLTDWCGDYLTCRVLNLKLRLTSSVHERTYRSAECLALLDEAGYSEVALERYRVDWFWGMMTVAAVHAPP